MMRKAVVGITLFLLAAPLLADEKLNDRMMHAASILQEIRGPLEEDAPGVLENAYAVAVFPEFVQVGLLGGVKHGQGVLATRLESGNWSKPAFVRITSGSFGLQFGVSMSQLLIVFKDPKAVEAISGGQFSIGADAGYAAGELGGSASAGTDNKLENRIVAMARSKGLFAGVALEGGVLRIEKDSNVEFYNDAIGLDGRTLLEDTEVELPPVAQHFRIVLGESVPPVSAESPQESGEDNSDVDLRFADDENTGTVAESAPEDPASKNSRASMANAQGSATPGASGARGGSGGSWISPDGRTLPSGKTGLGSTPATGAGNNLRANVAPEAATWVTPQAGSPQPGGDQSSGSGLGGRIAGKLTDAALDGAKDLAVSSIRDKPEVKAAKLAARAAGKLASSAGSGSSAPASASARSPRKTPLPKPEGAIASTDGAWLAPREADFPTAGPSPDSIPSVAATPTAELIGPPGPSEWPDEWRDAQILGGVCEPGT